VDEDGEADKAVKLQPSQMLERIKAEHPGRLDVPTEGDVRKEVSRLVAARKKAVEQAAAAASWGAAAAGVPSAAAIGRVAGGGYHYRKPDQ
jgi:hypothetical protein